MKTTKTDRPAARSAALKYAGWMHQAAKQLREAASKAGALRVRLYQRLHVVPAEMNAGSLLETGLLAKHFRCLKLDVGFWRPGLSMVEGQEVRELLTMVCGSAFSRRHVVDDSPVEFRGLADPRVRREVLRGLRGCGPSGAVIRVTGAWASKLSKPSGVEVDYCRARIMESPPSHLADLLHDATIVRIERQASVLDEIACSIEEEIAARKRTRASDDIQKVRLKFLLSMLGDREGEGWMTFTAIRERFSKAEGQLRTEHDEGVRRVLRLAKADELIEQRNPKSRKHDDRRYRLRRK
ncbi:MAG TPA: hypothetical protein PKC43_06585 [Phycisphaerales bacterium]|nr:hypothetical protein [Phycisphaerales bacterium]HMP37098.1 hypothetical protein [Phycisphaerales bacterium]